MHKVSDRLIHIIEMVVNIHCHFIANIPKVQENSYLIKFFQTWSSRGIRSNENDYHYTLNYIKSKSLSIIYSQCHLTAFFSKICIDYFNVSKPISLNISHNDKTSNSESHHALIKIQQN